MKNWQLLSMFFFLGCSGPSDASYSKQASANERPNIIFIISDDLGYGSLGSYGGTRFETPNLDYWANNGLRFTAFYVASPVCSPSRASILSGKTPPETGVEEVLRPSSGTAVKGMNTKLPTIAELLNEKGYNTALIGKWHLGYRTDEHPLNRGFDHFKGFLGGAINYLSHEYTKGGHAFSEGFNSWKPEEGKHATEIFTDEAISFIEQERKQPYLLMLTYANPHRPFIFPGDENIREEKPDKRLNTAKRYKRMVKLLDHQLGRIESSCAKLQQNTIILFISDNGANSTLRANGALRGGKGSLFEGGIKVPAIVYWPGKILPTEISDVTSVYDIYPTLLQLGGIEEDNMPDIDGNSFLAAGGQYKTPAAAAPLYWRHNSVRVVRNGKWKAMFIPANRELTLDRYIEKNEQAQLIPLSKLYDGHIPLLYDLEDDPYEQNNLSRLEKETLTNLWRLLDSK